MAPFSPAFTLDYVKDSFSGAPFSLLKVLLFPRVSPLVLFPSFHELSEMPTPSATTCMLATPKSSRPAQSSPSSSTHTPPTAHWTLTVDARQTQEAQDHPGPKYAPLPVIPEPIPTHSDLLEKHSDSPSSLASESRFMPGYSSSICV